MSDFYWPCVAMVALDLETTGLNRVRDRIIQYGIYGLDERGQKVALSAVVDAEVSTGREPKNLPGVALIDVMKAEPLRDGHLSVLYNALHGAVVVMHNAAHDWTFIQEEFRRNHVMPPVPIQTCCTLAWSRRFMHPPHKLHSLCTRLFIAVPHAHNAFHDARATFYLWLLLINAMFAIILKECPILKPCFAVCSKYFLPCSFRDKCDRPLLDLMPNSLACAKWMDLRYA